MENYIDVEKLIEKCHPIIDVSTSIGNVGVTLEEIRAIPAADVRENARGKWVQIHGENVWECSNCGKRREYILTKFCSNCGADMRGENDAR